MILTYSIEEVTPYLNWVYFFHAWGFQPKFATIAQIHGCDTCRAMWLASFSETERSKASEAMQLHKEALRMLHKLKVEWKLQSLFRLCEANADGDDIWIEGIRFPLLRQQSPSSTNAPCLCLSDFIRPKSTGIADCIGLFASSVSIPNEDRYKNDDAYLHLLIQTLSDRLAEAVTEKMHEYVRKTAWGYAFNEHLSIPEILVEKFQGIRPAVGYPSLPDQSVNFLLDELLDMKKIGITLTENGAMQPHASVSGLMIAHPQAHYFSIGNIGDDQMNDYAKRRGFSLKKIQKFLQS
ncbi:methionine synthase (B12-dependent) [gut metagenome]|uniref:Methionine synthase (B12-dependent) n=1 Tax=gut metagenome TaxID=749906 RepID=J9G301_9ZZZZ